MSGTRSKQPLDREAARRFGERLSGLMRKAGMVGETLALKCGVSPAGVSRWRQGHNYPSNDNLRKIRTALGCSWEDLFPGFEREGI